MRDKTVVNISLAERPKTTLSDDALVLVPIDQAPVLWPEVSKYLHSANEYAGDKFAMHDWLARVLNGKAELYVNSNKTCSVICEVIQFPRRRVYSISLLGGDGGHDYATYQHQWEQAAKRYGCSSIEIYGRAGWKRVMNELDYSLSHFVWSKEL